MIPAARRDGSGVAVFGGGGPGPAGRSQALDGRWGPIDLG